MNTRYLLLAIAVLFGYSITSEARVYVCPKNMSTLQVVPSSCKLGPRIPAYICNIQGAYTKTWKYDTAIFTSYPSQKKYANAKYLNKQVLSTLYFHTRNYAQTNNKWILLCVYKSRKNDKWIMQVGCLVSMKKCVPSKINKRAFVCSN